MQKKIEAYIEAHEQEMLKDAMDLIAINSERMEAKPGMPFGEGTAKVFEKAIEIINGHGFPVKNYENYVLTADLNDKPSRLDILAHLDVVPAGEGFTVTGPFEPIVKDGMLYGRGSADDKGPAVAALYAMRAVKELGAELNGNCRLILGADEECGSSDIHYYYEKEQEAPMTFSPDADFPLINIEKGGLHMSFSAETECAAAQGAESGSAVGADGKANTCAAAGIGLASVQCGTKINVVPGDAKAMITGCSAADLEPAAAAAAEKTGTAAALEDTAEGVLVHFKGAFCHAASPENGNNALTALLAFLAEVPFADEKVKELLGNLAKLFPHGDWNGKALGVNHEDEKSGKLTLSLNLFSYDGKTMTGAFDCRAPLCANEENTGDVVRARLSEAGFTPDDSRMYESHHVPEESELVQTLLSCYEEVTGKKEKPLAIGGGTYVHHIQNGVAFGCADPAVDNHMHGADEFMSVEQMKKSAVIFAMAILKLCR